MLLCNPRLTTKPGKNTAGRCEICIANDAAGLWMFEGECELIFGRLPSWMLLDFVNTGHNTKRHQWRTPHKRKRVEMATVATQMQGSNAGMPTDAHNITYTGKWSGESRKFDCDIFLVFMSYLL